MNRVAIFGVGLIGGSFALALRKAGFQGEIAGNSSPRTIASALKLGVIDRQIGSDEAVETCDLLYLSQPIITILSTLEKIGPRIRPGTLVTDAGSTKRLIVEKAIGFVRQGIFVGGHPMAGKERSGVEEADADLFKGRTYVLTPCGSDDLGRPESAEFCDWIVKIGARPVVLEPDAHDRLVAYTSHAPQLLSTALASVLADVNGSASVAGPGVLGLTRLAMSPFGVWRDILLTNQQHIDEAMAALMGKLSELRGQISSASMEAEFERAGAAAKFLKENQRG